MDALAKLNEHFLSCNICTETFKDPCTLGCYHTFCRPCLTKYTKTRRDAITAKSILCPNCNQMTKVPRPQEPVDLWCQQFKPSYLIQGLLDSFAGQESQDSNEDCCVSCQQIGKTTQARSLCEDCDILLCEACAKMHQGIPVTSDHVISPLGAGSTPKPKKQKVMCVEHNCLVEYFCKDCTKVVCQKCCIIHHRKCNSVVTLDSMIPEMKQVLQQNYDDLELRKQQTGNTLKSRRSEVEEITQHESSLQSEIRRVSQQAVDVNSRKEKKFLDELETLTEKQTGELRSQIKSGEIDMQTYQQCTEFIKQVLQSNSPMDIYDMYTLCQSGEITAELQRKDKQEQRIRNVVFKKQLFVDSLDRTLQLGNLRFVKDTPNLEVRPSVKDAHKTKPTVKSEPNPEQVLSTVNAESNDDKKQPNIRDVEVLNIRGTETLVVTDYRNSSVKSCYTKDKLSYCTSLKLNERPFTLTKISQDRVAVSYLSHNSIELIKLTPDPVLISTIRTKKKYKCLTALSDTTLAAGCGYPTSIDVLDLSGRVLRSVITPSTGQQLIQEPWFMCTTRQSHIVVADWRSQSIYCVTQQGEIIYQYKLTRGWFRWTGGVTTTDTGSVILANYWGNKIVQLTETGQYVRDLLTRQDGIVEPQGIRVHGNKLYVTQWNSKHIKIFQL